MPLDTALVKKQFKVIGTRVARPDGIDKVTGRAKYGADAFAPGQLIPQRPSPKVQGCCCQRQERQKEDPFPLHLPPPFIAAAAVH